MGETTLAWKNGEYRVLSTEEIYVEVARHRLECRITPELFAAPAP